MKCLMYEVHTNFFHFNLCPIRQCIAFLSWRELRTKCWLSKVWISEHAVDVCFSIFVLGLLTAFTVANIVYCLLVQWLVCLLFVSQLMSKMAPLLGRDITERMFLPRFCEMLTDPLFHVRKVSCLLVKLRRGQNSYHTCFLLTVASFLLRVTPPPPHYLITSTRCAS